MKKAYIVDISMSTRVIAKSEEQAEEYAKENFHAILRESYRDCIEDVYEDEEVPYGELKTDK